MVPTDQRPQLLHQLLDIALAHWRCLNRTSHHLLPRATTHKLAFRTNDDVFPLLPDILSTCWDPAACSGESGWSVAERRADEFISSSQCEHRHAPSGIRTAGR